MQQRGEHMQTAGSPGGMWLWFPAYGGGDADFNFKVLYGHDGPEAFGNYFEWYAGSQAYRVTAELFDGLVDCDLARAYTGETIVNTWPEM